MWSSGFKKWKKWKGRNQQSATIKSPILWFPVWLFSQAWSQLAEAVAHAFSQRRPAAVYLWWGAWLPHTWAYLRDRGVQRGTPVLSYTAGRILHKSPMHSTDFLPWRPPFTRVSGDDRGTTGWSDPGFLFNSARKETYLKIEETKEDRSGFASTVSLFSGSSGPCSTIWPWSSAIWKEKDQPENWYLVASLASWCFK